MNIPAYSLSVSNPAVFRRARRWLLLGVIALGVAGIFAGMLGSTQSAFFYTALVVHVDLSVLVWFLTMACMFFALSDDGGGIALVADAAFYCMAGGAALIVAAAATGGMPYMSNYIPVIHHPVFFLGLSLLLCSVLGMTFNVLVANWRAVSHDAQTFGVISAALIMLVTVMCFFLSWRVLQLQDHDQSYYENVFWAGGHVLQFVHTQLMVVCWLWLASVAGIRTRLSQNIVKGLYCFGLIAAGASLWIYHFAGPVEYEHSYAFTQLMKHGNGLAPLVAALFILAGWLKSGDKPAEPVTLPKIALGMSLLLFAAGGTLGYMIAGSNVTVPAHYHGSIVSVTLAYMGVAYYLLPRFGFADVARSKLAWAQPVVYGGGQLCWMAGMAILGAHGVPRKTPGSADTVGALASFLKHGGDGLALIGGLLFVFVVLKAVMSTSKK